MKIDSPKTFRAPERKESSVVAPRREATSTAPQRPSRDGFEARPTGTQSLLAPPRPAQAGANFDMPPQLEPYRGVFSRVAERIAKNPSLQNNPELEARVIDRAAKRILRRLPEGLSDLGTVRDTLTNAVRALRGQDLDDEQFGCSYRSNSLLAGSPAVQEKMPALQKIALPIASNPALKSVGDILKEARPQIDELGLKGREKALANRYVVSLVKEVRGREGASTRPSSLDTGDWRKKLEWRP